MPTMLEISIGERFGRLRIVREVPRRLKRRQFLVKCDCGNEAVANLIDMTRGVTQSCGCIRAERIANLGRERQVHGHAKGVNGAKFRTPEYRSWEQMKRRCLNKMAHNYERYGGRGISVCPRWRDDFGEFLADMGRKPSPHHTLDRVDNGGDYEPDNCRWATPKEQAQNRRPPRRSNMMEI